MKKLRKHHETGTGFGLQQDVELRADAPPLVQAKPANQTAVEVPAVEAPFARPVLAPKVLIVNDNAASLTALESLLAPEAKRLGYEVMTARSGEEALRQVLHHEFAVIVLDVRMPAMDGFETAAAIHAHPRSALLPIIFVTAHQSDEINRVKGYQNGAVDYLLTPIIPQILQTKVAVFVELKKKNLQLHGQAQELARLNQDLRIQRVQDLERLNTELAAEVVERQKAQQREHELATRDPLTGLLNRRSLMEQLEHAVVNAARRKEQCALLFLDLNRFKAINDTLGHEVGDHLLRQIAARLLEAVRGSDIVARLGGDEFVVLMEAVSSSTMAARVASKVAQSLARPYQIGDHEVKTSASIGIGLYPQDGTCAQSLINKADKAMYHAKHNKRGGIQFFHDELNALEVENNLFKRELQQALKGGQFELYFQPRMEVGTGRLTAVQTQLYWHHPRRGLMPARQFVPQVEAGQLVQLGEWMLLAACRQARTWMEGGTLLGKLPLAIDANLPQVPTEMPQSILALLSKQKLPRSTLQLGVVESMLMRDTDKTPQVLREFRKAGVQLAIDNFGTGYSSLVLLKALPLDLLKIDECLIQAMDDNPRDADLVGGVVCIARALNLRVVAQGVNTVKQLATLKALGCHDYQGDLLTTPLPATALAQWLVQNHPAPTPV